MKNEERYIEFSNADGKRWRMPVRGMRVAMHLYQPSGWRGRLVKWLLPWLWWSGAVRRVAHAQLLCGGQWLAMERDKMQNVLEECFGMECQLAFFFGTPSVHQKTTVQVFRHREILGYIKMSDSGEVRPLFLHEKRLLRELRQRGVCGVPQCLACCERSDGMTVFAQSTEKTLHSAPVHEWSALHTAFADQLYERTRQRQLFERTGFYAALTALQTALASAPAFDGGDVIASAVRRIVDRYADREVEWGVVHGDFTPWNMTRNHRSLFVFDWEYGAWGFPPMTDICHYHTQSLIFERHLDADAIISTLARHPWFCRTAMEEYLIAVIARYVGREHGDFARVGQLRMWIDLLARL